MARDPTPTALGEVAVWEAFRALRTDGGPFHPALARQLNDAGFFELSGSTLEVGAGDGQLWRAGGARLMAAALSRGRLHLTDSDPQLIEACRGEALFRHDGVLLEVADVEALPYAGGSFVRVIATHVLHWCATPERVRRAVRALARVLCPQGRALIVTVDERVHMREVYRLMQEARAALLARGIRCEQEIPDASPRVLPFCAGNAPALLGEAFHDVERTDLCYRHWVDARHPTLGLSGGEFFVAYLRTLPFVKEAVATGRLPEELFEEARALFDAQLQREGAFCMSRADVIYHCRGPRP